MVYEIADWWFFGLLRLKAFINEHIITNSKMDRKSRNGSETLYKGSQSKNTNGPSSGIFVNH